MKSFVTSNFETLRAEIDAGGGAALFRAYELAGVRDAGRAELSERLKADPALHSDPEALTVSLMVHGS